VQRDKLTVAQISSFGLGTANTPKIYTMHNERVTQSLSELTLRKLHLRKSHDCCSLFLELVPMDECRKEHVNNRKPLF
jgi:hypothetical protein